jgi:hypothetical protein
VSNPRKYWDRRYAAGGTSGLGSVGTLRDWKHQVILSYAGTPASVIDVGCGDLSFWHGCPPESYTGIDLSTVIIARNQRRYPDRRWICSPGSVRPPVTAPVVLCLDLLFHLLDETEYRRTLETLCACSERWIFIYTWHTNPIPAIRWQIRVDHLRHLRLRAFAASFWDLTSDHVYEQFRNLRTDLPLFTAAGFDLDRFVPYDQVGGMYVFRKREEKHEDP